MAERLMDIDIEQYCEKARRRKASGQAFNVLPDHFLALAAELMRYRRAEKGIASDLIVGLTEFSDALAAGDLSAFRVTRVVRKPGGG